MNKQLPKYLQKGVLGFLLDNAGRYLGRFIIYNISYTALIILTYLLDNRKHKAMPAMEKGFTDHRAGVVLGGAEYENTLLRIANAYNKAKKEQGRVAQPYQVGVMWQRTLDSEYVELNTALCNYDTGSLKAILENFSREPMAANQGGGVDYFCNKKKPLYKYLFVNTWYKYFNMYKEVIQREPDLDYPLVGNPAGLYYGGKVIPIEAIRFSYCAEQILPLLDNKSHPVICEIGGGNGGQTYALISKSAHALTYINLDIPEMLAIATYFLMTALPEKRFLLYGEGQLDSSKLEQYDIVLMPNFALPQLGNETVDLFFNQRSFSEMDGKTVLEYLHQIERICRGYLMHINHNKKFIWHEDGNKTENMPCIEVMPDARLFKKIYEYPWMFNRLEDEINYKGAGNIAFLYERWCDS